MNFARHVFLWSGIYGFVVLTPLLFLGDRYAPASSSGPSHPEHYYAFVAVGLAWQLAFLLISRDLVRFRPLMPAAMAEKFLSVALMVWLFSAGRIPRETLAPFLFDGVLGVLFVAAYRRTPAEFSRESARR